MVTLVPSIAFISLNKHFYTKRQIFNSLALVLCIGAFISYFGNLLYQQLIASLTTPTTLNLAAAFFSALAVCIYIILNERFFCEVFSRKSTRMKVIVSITLGVALLSFFIGFIAINCLLILLLFAALADSQKGIEPLGSRPVVETVNYSKVGSNQALESTIQLKHKPNIYLLVLESFHGSEALKLLYNITAEKSLNNFKQFGYTVYDNTFSNADNTPRSIETILCCTPNVDFYDSSFAMHVLRTNGYSCNFFDVSSYAFGKHVGHNDFTSWEMPKIVIKLYDKFGPLLGQSRFIRKLAQNIDPFETGINFKALYSSVARKISTKPVEPHFFAMRFGANHRVTVGKEWQKEDKVWINSYRTAFKQAEDQLAEMLQLIHDKDKDALVIAVGDHGGFRQFGCWNGTGSLDENRQKNGISMHELAHDSFGVMLAIKWSHKNTIGNNIISHANIFRYVFASLGADKSILADLEPNISQLIQIGGYCVVKDGVIFDKLGYQYNAEQATLQRIERQIQAGSASITDQVAFAQKQLHMDWNKGVSLLKEIIKIYPEQAYPAYVLGKTFARENYNSAKKYFQKAHDCDPHNTKYALSLYDWLIRNSDFINAQKLYEQASLADVDLATVITCQGLGALGKFDDLVVFLERSHQNFPTNQTLTYFQATALYEIGRFSDCICLIEKVLHGTTLFNTSLRPLLQNLLTWAYIAIDELDRAESVMLAQDERQADIAHKTWFALKWALLFEKKREPERAVNHLLQFMATRCLTLEPARRIYSLTRQYKLPLAPIQPYIETIIASFSNDIRLMEQKAFFDTTWYVSNYAEAIGTEDPAFHFMTKGVYHALNPNPWFKTTTYIINHVGSNWVGDNPAVHYAALEDNQYTFTALTSHTFHTNRHGIFPHTNFSQNNSQRAPV